MLLYAGAGLAAVVVVLALVVAVRASGLRSRQVAVEPAMPMSLDSAALAERLAGAIRFRTVCRRNPAEVEWGEFDALRAYLERAFPRLHAALRRETVNGHSYLYTWQGTDASAPPALLLAHLDVVPVEPGTEAAWHYAPFSGAVAEGFVWGRGAMDDKASALAILEAVESLVACGFRPRRTLLIAFGHDEEIGGSEGAARVAELLRQRGVRAEAAIDEGLAITSGIVPGVSAPVALIGIAEKGAVSVELAAEGEGGHSSRPSTPTTVGLLARALTRLESAQFPARIVAPVRETFAYTAPEMRWPMKAVFANLWLFGGLVRRKLAAKPSTNAQVRTTAAPTMLAASLQENVLPASARAVVNYRILPGDSIAGVLAHVRRVVGDSRIRVGIFPGIASEPSRVSASDSPAFRALEIAVRQVFPEAVVAPSIVIGASDSRFYESVSRDVYRFVPLVVSSEDVARVHGANERIAIENYERIVRFYLRLAESWTQ